MDNNCDDDKHFKCVDSGSYNACISPPIGLTKDNLKCDGRWDCRDGYDEHDCRKDKQLIHSPRPYLKPYQTYDMFDKVHCYTRKNPPFRPNLSFEAIKATDAIPCHAAVSTCTTLDNYHEKDLAFGTSFCPKESSLTRQDLIERFARNPCINSQDHCDQLCLWNEPEEFDWSGDLKSPIQGDEKIELKFMSSYECACVPGYSLRSDNKAKCKSDAGAQFYDLIMLENDEGEFLVQSVNPPKEITEHDELIEKTYFSSSYIVENKQPDQVVRYFETDFR